MGDMDPTSCPDQEITLECSVTAFGLCKVSSVSPVQLSWHWWPFQETTVRTNSATNCRRIKEKHRLRQGLLRLDSNQIDPAALT